MKKGAASIYVERGRTAVGVLEQLFLEPRLVLREVLHLHTKRRYQPTDYFRAKRKQLQRFSGLLP